jgi:hypothetical protein
VKKLSILEVVLFLESMLHVRVRKWYSERQRIMLAFHLFIQA